MKIIAQILAFFILLVFALWFFTNQSRIKLKDKLKTETKANDSLLIASTALNDSLTAFKNAKTTIDTIEVVIQGETKRIYIYDTLYLKQILETQSQSDSIITDELKLNYTADYIGELYGIDLTWEVLQKEITNDNIVYIPEPYPVEKIVYKESRKLYIGGGIATYNGVNLYMGIIYTTKKRTAFTFNYGFDKSYQAGAFYKLF